jgi:hypothetical protein
MRPSSEGCQFPVQAALDELMMSAIEILVNFLRQRLFENLSIKY